ncbi:phosphonate metabolism transcriptional regulator PhnF [Pelagovum pacificum]|uniref:Phosphonate metabolism transcriptional regulator PhnF n=1 Tax=Pelagovum pacificum TaxID=2588711 RepID=A0A5C5GE78_9RHOB|nr:phosphonate metabolism transcriptional regulator PhnF [Pelagovum pacificum]QQA43850.1 phosphonate metabolism transcriptional regulator PhnF [Pelagovum pacificum]TNY33018.1 phosphonate metabolism transcriptional regulator PhnF [Pelagovum pacificum]
MTEQPIWAAIAAALRAEIAEGARRPGDRLPTEAQLADRFGVNRHTVRRGLAALADEGLVRSRRGAGVYVAPRSTDYQLGRRVRFHRNIEAAGRLPEKRFTLIETRPARPVEAAALGLDETETVVASDGISLSDGSPIALFTSIFPTDRLPGMADALARVHSVTEALRLCGVPDYVRTSTRISGVTADAAQAARLEIRPGAALIHSESINVDTTGRPIEYGQTFFVGERVTLTLDHS